MHFPSPLHQAMRVLKPRHPRPGLPLEGGGETSGCQPASRAGSPFLPEYLALPRPQMEAECRRRCQSAYLGDHTLLCRVLGKYLLFADTRDVGIMPHLCLDGYWEAWITEALFGALQPGWCCVDVGANHGYYSLLFADAVGPEGKVLACEPNPPIADLLEKTLSVNGFAGRSVVVRQAVTDIDGDCLTLVVPPQRTMNAFLQANAPQGIPIRTVTLDTLCQVLDRVDLVKIDAEGAEESIWRGMSETIRRNPGLTVLLEFNASRYPDPGAFLASIQAQGFSLAHVDYSSHIKPLTPEQILSERQGEDWMLWLQRR